MARKLLGFVLVLLGGLATIYFSMWPLTGNHGATWLQFSPFIAISGVILAIGIVLMKDKRKTQDQSSNEQNNKTI